MSTLGYERRFNASLQLKPQDQWVRDLLADMPLAPKYFPRMKQVNRDGPAILGLELPGQKGCGAKEAQRQISRGTIVLDARLKEAFAAAHIPGSINIGLGKNFATWAGWVLPYDQDLLVVVDRPEDTPEVATELTRIGLDHIVGYLDGGIEAWEQAGLPLEVLATMSAQDLHRRLGEVPAKLIVLDVRTDAEWNGGHIDGAIHIHGGRLEEEHGRVPQDKPVAVICGSGYRSSLAASLLQRRQYKHIHNVVGGMAAWKAAGLPVVDGADQRA